VVRLTATYQVMDSGIVPANDTGTRGKKTMADVLEHTAQVVHKLALRVGEELVLDWPPGSRVLRAECEHGGASIWFWVVGPVAWFPDYKRTFEIVATGRPFPTVREVHATAPDLGYSNLVWHLVSHETTDG